MTATHLSAHRATRGATDGRAPDADEAPPRSWWLRNALVLVCLALFLLFLGAQSLTGWHVFSDDAAEHGQETVSFRGYLTSGPTQTVRAWLGPASPVTT